MNAASPSDAKKTLLDLLGDSLSAEDREAVEREFFEQDALFEELLAAENELVDDLASGHLSDDIETVLERHPELIPDLETRAALSHKLSELAARQRVADQGSLKRFVPPSRSWQRIGAWLAAAVLVLTVGPLLWWWTQTASDVGPDARTRTTWVLSPSSARGAALPELRLPADEGSVTLILELDQPLGEVPQTLRVTLTDEQGVVRDFGSELQVKTFPWGLGVEVFMPEDVWWPGLQTLELFGIRSDGAVELLTTYQFELLRE